MRRIRIDKTDKYRVLLTEVLPYETPLFFSNEGFYRFCRRRLEKAPEVVKRILGGWTKGGSPRPRDLHTVAYTYQTRRGALDTRELSVMHPSVQLQFAEFYGDYAHTLVHLCSRSPLSLRRPAAIASTFYQPGDQDSEDDALRYSSNFFRYEKFGFLYDFFESYEFHRLEKRFHHLMTFDISKCFNHIYTHTISWAVRSKPFAKAHIGHRAFESEFDRLMQAANDKETAGILVGPEVSRLFAEIILQRVDSEVLAKLKEEDKHRLGVDFDVRRYVDDYFVFTESRDLAGEIMRLYQEKLRPYRLYLNEKKIVESDVPFMSPISCAKLKLRAVIEVFFASAWENPPCSGEKATSPALRILKRPGDAANRFILNIKDAVKTNGVEYASVTGFLMSAMERQLERILAVSHGRSQSNQAVGPILLALLDVAFFVYAMDVRVTNTNRIVRLVLAVEKSMRDLDQATVEQIKKKISDESFRLLNIEARRRPDLYLETLNLLPVLRILGDEYRLPSETLEKMVEILEESGQGYGPIHYFLATALLFHIGRDPKYVRCRERVQEVVCNFVATIRDPLLRTDCTCLFLDMLSCPFVDAECKQRLVKTVKLDKKLLTSEEIRDVLSVVPQRTWFTNWHARDRVDVLLEKTRYRTPY